jgi:nucleoside-diphosphate-sugar epimerase
MTRGRVLVTGSRGLIGEPLLRSLRDRSFEVYGVSRSETPDTFTLRADLSLPEQTASLLAHVNPSVIVHLAGGRERDAELLYESNVSTTANLLNASTHLESPPAFITAGSAAEYGEPAAGIATESSRADPVTEYGRAKLAASALALELSAASGIRVCVVRPFNIVSARLPASTALGNMREQLMAQTGSQRVVRCGRLDVVRDFVPLHFVVEVLSRLLDVEEWPRILNICSGTGIELGSVLRAMADCLDVDVHVIPIYELTSIPAAARIIGDATLLHRLGLHCEPTAASLARLLVADDAHELRPPPSSCV